ncbi:MAG: hypothetical protein LBQ86_04530 [Holophagales bacterium]|jgi:hypothetical protein|nr:hypothetical protein [Holophagales bacterium]
MNNLAKIALTLLVAYPALQGQIVKDSNSSAQKAPSAPNLSESVNLRGFKSKIFTIEHRNPRDLFMAIRGLGSGDPNALVQTNDMGDIKTITVRDFPENIAVIESAIKRLDVPMPEAKAVELCISVLWASKKDIPGEPVSTALSDVIKEISNTLNYKYFREAAIITSVIKNNSNASGTVIFGLPGEKTLYPDTSLFKWTMEPDIIKNNDKRIISGQFSISYGNTTHIKNAYINLKVEEKLLVGTATYGGLAMVVVVSAKEL